MKTKHILKAALMASVMAFSAGAVLAEGVTIAVVGGKSEIRSLPRSRRALMTPRWLSRPMATR